MEMGAVPSTPVGLRSAPATNRVGVEPAHGEAEATDSAATFRQPDRWACNLLIEVDQRAICLGRATPPRDGTMRRILGCPTFRDDTLTRRRSLSSAV
jgi:hypothetical protein